MSHTPGPWSVSGVRTRASVVPVLQISGPDDKVYAWVLYSDLTMKDHITSHADARLIAAAPDMLAALKLVRDWCPPGAIARVDAAIAKAIGNEK